LADRQLLKRVYDVYVIISSLEGTKVDGDTIYRMIDLKLKEWKPEEIDGECEFQRTRLRLRLNI